MWRAQDIIWNIQISNAFRIKLKAAESNKNDFDAS